KTMTLSFFITVIPDHDKPQPPGCLLGVDTSTASSLLAEQLPKIIDALSPQGEVSPQANNDLLSAGMELLKGKLFR
ncbi:hypothetical protein POW66_17450, partial [Escherichia coli]